MYTREDIKGFFSANGLQGRPDTLPLFFGSEEGVDILQSFSAVDLDVSAAFDKTHSRNGGFPTSCTPDVIDFFFLCHQLTVTVCGDWAS